MNDDQEKFLFEVFEEANAHIRENDRKSLLVTGVYVSLFSLFVGSLMRTTSPPALEGWPSVLAQAFFLIIGGCVFILQQWYRAWKMHYLEICQKLTQHFFPADDFEAVRDMLPYWLRPKFRSSRISVDNMFQYLVFLVNTVIAALLSHETLELTQRSSCGITAIVIGLILYVITVGTIWVKIHHKKLFHA